MKRKLISLILSAVMAVSLVGCGGAGDDGTTAGTSTDTPTKSESDNVDTPASAPSDDAQSLTVWCWDSFNVDAMKKAGEIYTADHPDVTINVQETVSSDIQTLIQTYAMSGELNALPDIFLMDDQVLQSICRIIQMSLQTSQIPGFLFRILRSRRLPIL